MFYFGAGIDPEPPSATHDPPGLTPPQPFGREARDALRRLQSST
jgi:endonuclease YncB( thermonuclease family)